MNNPTTRFGQALVFVVALAAAACGPGITIVKSSRQPDAEPLNLKGQKVAAVVMMQNQTIRRTAEDTLARAITKHGAVGIPMYTLLASPNPADEQAARTALEGAGVKGVIVLRPTRERKTKVTPEQSYMLPVYGGYWGGYYGYGWKESWGAPTTPVSPYGKPQGPEHGGGLGGPGYYGGGYGMGYGMAAPVTVTVPESKEMYDAVVVQIMVFSLKQNRLAWTGVAEAPKPDDVEDFVMDLTKILAKELASVRLIWG
jgi:hypothetical protein